VTKVIELLEEAKLDLIEFSRDTALIGVAMRALSRVEEAIAELETPRWVTPEQWEAEMGEPWPDDWAVYIRYMGIHGKWLEWHVTVYETVKFSVYLPDKLQIICATEAGPPPEHFDPAKQ
jgi:hypothetical protein